MTKFFTSDEHFGHTNILHLGEGRPFKDLNHMHSIIIRNHNSIVTPDDDVYFLGDIAMGTLEDSLKVFHGMMGNKFLIPGNHDKIFTGANSQTRIERFWPIYEEAGFTILPENTTIMVGEYEVALSHFPYAGDHTFKDRYEKNRPPDVGLPLLHGHTHQRTRFTEEAPNTLHVGVDGNNFTPVSESEVLEWIETL